MRLEAITVPDGTVLKFMDHSISVKSSEIANLGLQEAVLVIVDKLEKMAKLREVPVPGGIVETEVRPKGIVETEIVEPAFASQLELEGDEDDEDLSLYEDRIYIDFLPKTPRQHLLEQGVI